MLFSRVSKRACSLLSRRECKYPSLVAARMLSVTPNQENSQKKGIFDTIKSNSTLSLIVAGGSLTLYGISKLMIDLTSTFLSLTHVESLYYGFLGGCISTGALAAAYQLGYYATFMHPESVVRHALNIIKDKQDIIDRLQGPLRPVDVRVFNSTIGRWVIHKGSLTWKRPIVNTTFAIRGGKGDAIVIAQASRSAFQLKNSMDSLEIYYLDGLNNQPTHRVITTIDQEISDDYARQEAHDSLEKAKSALHEFTSINYRNFNK